MKCDQVIDVLDSPEDTVDALRRRAAEEHLSRCAHCRDAQHALRALHADATRPVPPLSDLALERALLAATRTVTTVASSRAGFWQGVGLGGLIAAGLALVAWFWLPVGDAPPAAAATPVVSIAPNAARDVRISLESPALLEEAGIHVVVSGAIALQGYEEHRELRWSTRLERGANQLTLPVVALGPGGGQLLVEVLAGQKRKTFVVDVRSDAAI